MAVLYYRFHLATRRATRPDHFICIYTFTSPGEGRQVDLRDLLAAMLTSSAAVAVAVVLVNFAVSDDCDDGWKSLRPRPFHFLEIVPCSERMS